MFFRYALLLHLKWCRLSFRDEIQLNFWYKNKTNYIVKKCKNMNLHFVDNQMHLEVLVNKQGGQRESDRQTDAHVCHSCHINLYQN